MLVCGLLQRFERVGVEEKINKTDVRDAAVVVGSGLERVVGYHHLFEGIAGVAKRECLLFPLLGGGDGVCGLNVCLPRTAIDDEIDFVLSYRVLPGGVVVALHNSDINGISTPDEFVVDGVFHEVREFRLSEVDARVPESGIGGVVFHRVVEVAAPLDVKSLSLADQKGVGKVVRYWTTVFLLASIPATVFAALASLVGFVSVAVSLITMSITFSRSRSFLTWYLSTMSRR